MNLHTAPMGAAAASAALYTNLEMATANGTQMAASPDTAIVINPEGTVNPMHEDSPRQPMTPAVKGGGAVGGVEVANAPFFHLDGRNATVLTDRVFEHVMNMQDSEDEKGGRHMCFCTRCMCPGGPCCRQVGNACFCQGCCSCCCKCVIPKHSVRLTLGVLLLVAAISFFVAFGVFGNAP